MAKHLSQKNQASQQGLTLIEVLIVLVILTIGILSALRLFPAGFIVFKNAQDTGTASRLGETMMDSVRKDGRMPDGVYASYLYNSQIQFDPTVTPDNLGSYPGTNSSYASDVNKARYVSGESVVVPAASPGSYPIGVLQFGPIFLKDPTQAAADVTVISSPWSEHEGSAILGPNGTPNTVPTDILKAEHPEFLIDYATGKIAVPPAPYVQTFDLTVSDSYGTAYTGTFTLPSSSDPTSPYTGDWIDPSAYLINSTTLPSYHPWKSGSASLVRPFAQVVLSGSGVPQFSGDPYEYALPNAFPGSQNIPNTYANMGVFAFNPAAAGHGSIKALTARVSYTVFDWHILRQDFDLAANGSYSTLRLAIPGVKHVGDINYDGSLFSSLTPTLTAPSPSQQFDLLMLDLDTGQVVPNTYSSSLYNLDDASGSSTGVKISYKTGRVDLNNAVTAKHIRVFYAGKQDWAVAMQKAPVTYTKMPSAASVTAPGALTPDRYWVSASKRLVCFPPCDENKTVILQNVVVTDNNLPKANTYQISSIALNLPGTTTLVNSTTPMVVGDISSDPVIKQITTNGYSVTAIQIGSVTGLSARAVVIWRDHGIWKQRTIDSLSQSRLN